MFIVMALIGGWVAYSLLNSGGRGSDRSSLETAMILLAMGAFGALFAILG